MLNLNRIFKSDLEALISLALAGEIRQIEDRGNSVDFNYGHGTIKMFLNGDIWWY